MANEKHLLLTAQGDYTDSSLAGEEWQVGVRLALVFGSVDPIGTLPNNWDLTPTTIARTETDWSITGNWKVVHSPASFNPDDYLNDQAAPAFAAWTGQNQINDRLRLKILKLSPIGAPSGRLVPAPPYATGTPCLLTWTGSYPVGGNTGGLTSPSVAVVASHRTSQIGRVGRGRMYIPGIARGAVGDDGLLTSSVQGYFAAAQVTLLEALALTGGVGTDPSVRPIVTGKPFTQYSVIDQVRVDNVLDTQRRRTRQLSRSVVTDAVTY